MFHGTVYAKVCNIRSVGKMHYKFDKKDGKMCKYCSYRAVCTREANEEYIDITNLTHLKALERLDGENVE